jgi:hypothetical protein
MDARGVIAAPYPYHHRMTYGYGYLPPPPPPPTKPPRDTADTVISIIAMVLTVLAGAGAAVMGLMLMAFTDHCPPQVCDVDRGINLMFTGFLVAAGIAITGIVLSIVRLVGRRSAWPFAVGGLVLTGAACLLALLGYASAVG